MVAKGYGEERPLRMKDGNVLTEKYINSQKTKEEQEALHQLNRRTVFRVISWDYVDPTKPVDQNQRKIVRPKVLSGAFDDMGDTTGADVKEEPQQQAPAPAPAPTTPAPGTPKPAGTAPAGTKPAGTAPAGTKPAGTTPPKTAPATTPAKPKY
jgi:outer membrane protein assembly factor BamE (lipoprotein component of BamABCDE complex)